MPRYKVLLLYPDYLNDSGTETYLAAVDAENEEGAIDAALKDAEAATPGVLNSADDFAVLYIDEDREAELLSVLKRLLSGLCSADGTPHEQELEDRINDAKHLIAKVEGREP